MNLDRISLKNFNCKAGERVIVRVDFNVPIANSTIIDNSRILAAKDTIQYLLDRKAIIILISHFGSSEDLSFEKYILEISNILNINLKFLNFENDPIAIVNNAKESDVFLLENIRFKKEEKANCDKLISLLLSKLGNFYINEAFSVSHRLHASVIGITKSLPSFMGCGFEKEISALKNSLVGDNIIGVFGGGKVKSKIDILLQCLKEKKVHKICTGGILANTLLKIKGFNIGKSLFDLEILNYEIDFINFIVPEDVIVAFDVNAQETYICVVDDIPDDAMILDIGPATSMKYKDILENATGIIMNGPMGYYENDQFTKGSQEILEYLKFIKRVKEISVTIGGGDSQALLNKLSFLNDDFTYVSTAGGAFMNFLLLQSEMPGLKAIIDSNS